MNKINLNDKIKVKLTQYGKECYIQYLKEVLNITKDPYFLNEISEVKNNEYFYFQLWDFMYIFGNKMVMGCKQIIVNNEIESEV